MSETVFILGAGASKEAGAPVMADFLDKARRLSKERKLPHSKDSFDLVFRGIEQLRLAHSNASIDLSNLESVFAAFEMARLLGRLGDMDILDVERLPEAMAELIQATLGASIIFHINAEKGRLNPIKPYHDLARMIYERCSSMSPGSPPPFSVLTFNYDPCLDDALAERGLEYDYCLDGDALTGDLGLLKLHGSLNWATCEECHRPSWWDIGKCVAGMSFHPSEIEDAKGHFPLSIVLHGPHPLSCCGHSAPDKPLIIPPTYSKGECHAELKPVWRQAAKELDDAENIYIIGFSLPETDQFFRYFYALGTMNASSIRRLWVYDPDPKGEVDRRYRELLGQGVIGNYERYQMTFTQALAHLTGNL